MSGLIKTLSSKPWLSGEDGSGAPVDVSAFRLPLQKVGLGVFFAVGTSLFLLFIVSYRMRMYYEDWVPLREPMLLWINSGILLLASVFMQRSSMLAAATTAATATAATAATNSSSGARAWFLLGGFAALVFVCLQLLIWRQLATAGYLVSTNPSSSFFYLVTAVHGVHVVGGLAAWVRTLLRGDGEGFRMGVGLCAWYWHFLLVVWALLFYLLLST